MFAPSPVSRSPRPAGGASRRGIALVFVLVFVIAMAALAMSSIFMASSSNLLAKSYDKERDLRFAAEEALAIGKSRVNTDPGILQMPADTLYRTLMAGKPVYDANNKVIPGVVINLYVGQTGSTSGQNGRFASIVAQAVDDRGTGVSTGNGFIRRLELTQESFAKFAYWSNSETNATGTTIFFNSGDELWGPVWSNDNISIGSLGATFHDQVGTAGTIAGKNYGTFVRPPLEKQTAIKLPTTTTLNLLNGYAALGNASLVSADGPNNLEQQTRDRIEFVAFNPDPASSDSSGDDEGFFRYFQGASGKEGAVRGDWASAQNTQCGDWHYMPVVAGDTALKFFPVSVHVDNGWFETQLKASLIAKGVVATSAATQANTEANLSRSDILGHAKARCYLAGDPHLVATERTTAIKKVAGQVGAGTFYTAVDIQRGGEDTTFTPVGVNGSWLGVPQTSLNAMVATKRPADGLYLFPISRKYSANAKGVIYASGNVGVSGVINGQVTLYAKGDIVILDDIRYANDPAKAVCHDILGMISDFDVMVANNAINTPVAVTGGYRSMDDTKDLYLHAVIMALGTSFQVEGYDLGPNNANDCEGTNNGRGCLYLSGGLIQKSRGPVGQSNGNGYKKVYVYDHCAVVTPPPYFPTTGRFQDNRYIELDPAGFDPLAYFRSVTP